MVCSLPRDPEVRSTPVGGSSWETVDCTAVHCSRRHSTDVCAFFVCWAGSAGTVPVWWVREFRKSGPGWTRGQLQHWTAVGSTIIHAAVGRQNQLKPVKKKKTEQLAAEAATFARHHQITRQTPAAQQEERVAYWRSITGHQPIYMLTVGCCFVGVTDVEGLLRREDIVPRQEDPYHCMNHKRGPVALHIYRLQHGSHCTILPAVVVCGSVVRQGCTE